MIDNSKEYIVASAYFLKERNFPSEKRLIYKHQNIRSEDDKYDDIYDLRISRHHAEILHQFGKEVNHRTDGFYTSWGRWVDRETAAKIAVASGQCAEGSLIMGDRLDSSDVFK